jgi:hypothetical protein
VAGQTLAAELDGQALEPRHIAAPGPFEVRYALPSPVSPGPHTVDVSAAAYYVPARFNGGGDYRPLAWQFEDAALLP